MPLHRHALRALIFSGALAGYVGSASAQQAPITYAGGQPVQADAAMPISLVGGGENSYGYGAAQRRREGAVIDIRRPSQSTQARTEAPATTAPSSPEPVQDASSASEVRPEWLEEERVGAPYQANGRWYVPTPEPGYAETGRASWYGPQFHGRRTASGETFDQEAMTAAHPTLPLNSLVQVTNLENGREVIVRVNDRGPFARDRLIDLSRAAAQVLDFERAGHARVHVRYLGPAPRRVDPATAAATPVAPSAPGAAEEAEGRRPEEGPTSLAPPPTSPQMAPSQQEPPAPAQVVGGYFVQVGAFSDVANAQRVREAVVAAGPVSIDVRRTASGAELFRVRVGPLQSEAEAEAARASLASLGYGDSIVAAR